MTAPTLTCETCESDVDPAADPRCIQDGGLDVICAACRERAWERWSQSTLAGEWPPSDLVRLREAYKVKRGFQ